MAAEIEELSLHHGSTAAASSSLASGPDVALSIGDRLATGSFGSVAEATFRGETGWVVKSSNNTKDKCSTEMIDKEILVLRDMQGVRGFPVLRAVVRDGDTVRLVIQRLPYTLAQLTHIAPLPLEDVCRIAVQTIDALEALHDKGWVHRDIKPDNTMLDDRAGLVYLIDFGLAKRIIDEKGAHIPDLHTKRISGTPRYCSIPIHEGHTASRRDDLESLVYSLQYVLGGHLPWAGAKFKRDNNYAAHLRKKKEVGSRIYTGPLLDAYNYVRQLRFDERPDYDLLREAFLREIPGSSRTKLTQFRFLSRELEIGRPTRRRLDDIKFIAQVAIRGLRSNHKLRAQILNCIPASDRLNWALLAHNDASASVSFGSAAKDGESRVVKPKNKTVLKREMFTVGVQNLICDTTVVFRLDVPAPPAQTKYTFSNSSRILWCCIAGDNDVSLCAVNVLTGQYRHYRSDPDGPITRIPYECVFVSWSGCLVRHSDRAIDLVTYDSKPLSVEIGTEARAASSNSCHVHRVVSDHPINMPTLMIADGASILVYRADSTQSSWQVFATMPSDQGDAASTRTLRLQQCFEVKYPHAANDAVFSQAARTLAVWFSDQVIFHVLSESPAPPTSTAIPFGCCRRVVAYGDYWVLFSFNEIAFVDAKTLTLHPRRIVFSDQIHDLNVSSESVLVGHDLTTRILQGEELLRTPPQQVQLWGNCNRLVIGTPRCLLIGHRPNADSSLRIVVSSLIIDPSTMANLSDPLPLPSSSSAKRRLDFDVVDNDSATEKHPRPDQS